MAAKPSAQAAVLAAGVGGLAAPLLWQFGHWDGSFGGVWSLHAHLPWSGNPLIGSWGVETSVRAWLEGCRLGLTTMDKETMDKETM